MSDAKRPKAALVTDDSFAAAVRVFKRSPKFLGYSESTQTNWGRELDFMARPNCLGAMSLQELRPSVVQAYFDGIDDRKGKQAAGLAVLKQFEKWAIVREVIPRQITLGVEFERSSDGHIPWTDEQVAHGEEFSRPFIARAITLAANTGQRGSDLIRMCPTDIETYRGMDGINVTQKKTGRQVWIPITSDLATSMRTWDRKPGPFLRNRAGDVYTRSGLSSAWNEERDTNPELKCLGAAAVAGKPTSDSGLVLHGLRGTACVRLRRSGASIPQIADMVGMSEEMVARYCRFSIQKENAVAAVIHLERTISERNPDISQKRGS